MQSSSCLKWSQIDKCWRLSIPLVSLLILLFLWIRPKDCFACRLKFKQKVKYPQDGCVVRHDVALSISKTIGAASFFHLTDFSRSKVTERPRRISKLPRPLSMSLSLCQLWTRG